MSDTEITPVIFRKTTPRYGSEVTAIFPTDAASYKAHECGCYAHVGQHGACDPWHVIRHSHPATPAEYAALKAELEAEPYGYRLRVHARMQWRKWDAVRQEALRAQGARVPSCHDAERREIVGRLAHEGA